MARTTDLLGCKYPVILGAMGVICNPEVVAAVSEAGGFGVLATSFASDVDVFRAQVKATKALTDKPFGANLQVMNPLSVQFVEVLAEEGVNVITISGGSPKAIFPVLKDHGMKVIPVVPTVDVAKKAEILGADAIVAEGSESGGIQGFRGASTMVLVPAMADAVKVPVIAAGGISDSRGYRAALALGADGVQVGTRFIASTECVAHDNYKNFIVESQEVGTGLVNMGPFRIRALRTPLVERRLSEGAVGEGFEGFSEANLEESWVKGDMDAGILPAGQGIGLIHNVQPVREIIEEMVK